MNTQNSHTTLPIEDIHLPEAVSAWPPAIGWWLLAILLIIVAIGLYLGIKWYKKKWGYRNAALRLLNQYYKEWKDNPNSISTLHQAQQMATILKRTAMSAYPHQNTSTLYGEDWITFLNQQTPTVQFEGTLAEFLSVQQYQVKPSNSTESIPLSSLHSACKYWIKKHTTTYQKERGK